MGLCFFLPQSRSNCNLLPPVSPAKSQSRTAKVLWPENAPVAERSESNHVNLIASP